MILLYQYNAIERYLENFKTSDIKYADKIILAEL